MAQWSKGIITIKLVRGLVDPKKVVYYREVVKNYKVTYWKTNKNCTKQNYNNVQKKKRLHQILVMADFETLLQEAESFCFESVIRSVYQTAKVT